MSEKIENDSKLVQIIENFKPDTVEQPKIKEAVAKVVATEVEEINLQENIQIPSDEP